MVNADITYLQSRVEKANNSLASLDKLVAYTKEITQSGLVDHDKLITLQKQTLLDSFTVKKFHREYKEWENSTRNAFVEGQVKAYNKKYAQISRLHSQSSGLEDTLRDLRAAIRLPKFLFSIQTLEQYEDGKLLEVVEKDANGEYPRRVGIDQLFSLDPSSVLPHPSYQEFNKLVNMEYRMRTQLQIKYEVLLRIKTSLAAKNSQWATRDSTLNKFITQELPKVVQEVERIKSIEYEDLKYYEDDYDMEELDSETEALEEDKEEGEDIKELNEGVKEEKEKESNVEDGEEISEDENEEENARSVDEPVEEDQEVAQEEHNSQDIVDNQTELQPAENENLSASPEEMILD